VDKEPGAFRTISEVAEDLDLPQHVLRFWETRFSQIKPLKRGGGRRYYRPDDVELLRGIRHLLYGEGYTIRGVQRILKEEGVGFVQAVWRGEGGDPQADDDDDRAPPPAPRPPAAAVEPPPHHPRPEPPPSRPTALQPRPASPSPPPSSSPPPSPRPEPPLPAQGARTGLLGLLPKLSRDPEPPALPKVVEVPIPVRKEPPLFPAADEAGRRPFARPEEDGLEPPAFAKPLPVEPRPVEALPVEAPPVEAPPVQAHGAEPARAAPTPAAAVRVEPALRAPSPEVAPRRLSRDDIRRLQVVLRELQDCRRILDGALSAGQDA
jgi:DNA-binding transcriptional MerR regulator